MIKTAVFFFSFVVTLSLFGCEKSQLAQTEQVEHPDQISEHLPSCKETQRLFDHPLLVGNPLCIPSEPQRVVDLGVNALEVLQITGGSVIGSKPWATRILAKNYPYLREDINAIANIGDPLDLETVAMLNPDMIFATSFSIQGIEDKLRAIAPLVVFQSTDRRAWREGYEFAGLALNKRHAVEQLERDYFERIKTLREVLINKVGQPQDIRVSIARLWGSNSEMAMNLVNSFSSAIVEDAGLGRPESQALSADAAKVRYKTDGNVRISLERIDLLDGDVLFLWSEAPDDKGDKAAEQRYLQLLDDPVWNSLSVVQNQDVVRAGGHWVGWGYHAAHAVIDDLFEHVAGVEPDAISPNPMQKRQMQTDVPRVSDVDEKAPKAGIQGTSL